MLLEVQCKVSTVSDGLGCHVICWCWSTVFSEVHSQRSIYQEILEHFMRPSADKLYGDADFIFQQDFAPAHTAKATKSWFTDHGVTVLDWPANSPDLNTLENLDERHQTQQCRWPEGRYQKQPELHYTWAVPQTDRSPCRAALMQSFRQKNAQPSIECIEMNILFKSLTFLFKISFFIDLM